MESAVQLYESRNQRVNTVTFEQYTPEDVVDEGRRQQEILASANPAPFQNTKNGTVGKYREDRGKGGEEGKSNRETQQDLTWRYSA